MDNLFADAKPQSVVCHGNSTGILPVQWCLKNSVSLERPRGYEGQDFDWADYLKKSGTEAAPDACFPDVRPVKSLGLVEQYRFYLFKKRLVCFGHIILQNAVRVLAL